MLIISLFWGLRYCGTTVEEHKVTENSSLAHSAHFIDTNFGDFMT